MAVEHTGRAPGGDLSEDERAQAFADDLGLETLDPKEAAVLRAAWEDLDALVLAEGGEAPPDLEPPEAIHSDLRARRRALRRLPVVGVVLATFVLATGVALGLRDNFKGIPMEVGAVVLIALGLLSLLQGVRFGGLRPRLGVALLVGAGLIFSGMGLMEVREADAISNVAWNQAGCVIATLMWAIPGVAALLWALWGARLPTATTGALLGAGLGFFSTTFLFLHCPLISPLHLLLHHGGGILLLTLLGAGAALFVSRRTLSQP